MNLHAFTHQKYMIVHDLVRCLFWHRCLMSLAINFGSKIYYSQHKSKIKEIWADSTEPSGVSWCRPFLNIIIYLLLIDFWRTFDAFGSILPALAPLLVS